MAYPVLYNGGPVTFAPQMFDESGPVTFPTGTSTSAFTSDFNIATVVFNGGKVVLTPKGTVTGNVYVNLVATLPDGGGDVYGTILVHVMGAPLSAKNYIQLTPEV